MSFTLKSSLRGSDVIIRYGGEEFLIYLNDVQKAEVAYSIAESLRKKINEIYYDKGKN